MGIKRTFPYLYKIIKVQYDNACYIFEIQRSSLVLLYKGKKRKKEIALLISKGNVLHFSKCLTNSPLPQNKRVCCNWLIVSTLLSFQRTQSRGRTGTGCPTGV